MGTSTASPISARLTTAVLGAAMVTGAAMAQAPMPPPNPGAVEVKQGDTRLRLFFRGSPFYAWYEDANGYTVVRDGKVYVYARLDARGDLEPMKDQVVGKVDPSKAGVPRGVRPTPEAMKRAREAMEKKRKDRPAPPSSKAEPSDAASTPGAAAAPATYDGQAEAPAQTEVRRADGTAITLIDHGGWYEDPDHYAVVKQGDAYLYAVRNGRGQLTGVAGLPVARTDPAGAGLLKGLRPSAEAIARNQPVE